MQSRSSPIDPKAIVVADGSVVFNLIATRFAGPILDCLPNRLVVVEEAAAELEAGRLNGRQDADQLAALVAAGHIDIVQLGPVATEYFADLVSGMAADTLDDGEAATIAYTLERSAIALIDEHKAMRICAERFCTLETKCTIDLLSHSTVTDGLDRKTLSEIVFNALYCARMRVPTHHMDWVVNLIGRDRARKVFSGRNQVWVSEGN